MFLKRPIFSKKRSSCIPLLIYFIKIYISLFLQSLLYIDILYMLLRCKNVYLYRLVYHIIILYIYIYIYIYRERERERERFENVTFFVKLINK
jgi:hypothetical protein